MECRDFDATGYWRVEEFGADINKVDKNKLCACWLPRENEMLENPDLFCKPKRGCEDVSAGKSRTLALICRFSC